MYWMLLPLDANAGRQLSTDAGTTGAVWAHLFRAAQASIAYLRHLPRR